MSLRSQLEQWWDKEADPPVELVIWDRCKTYHCLPYAGGLLEQPHWIMEAFDIIEAFMKQKKDEQQREAETQAAMQAAEEANRRRLGVSSYTKMTNYR